MTRLLTIAFTLALAACGSKQTPPPSSQAPAPAEPATPAGNSMSAEQCTSAGGEVIGDIGDGAIHRPDYRCPKSGQPPLGTIASNPGEPVAIEGAVCCK